MKLCGKLLKHKFTVLSIRYEGKNSTFGWACQRCGERKINDSTIVVKRASLS